MRLFMGIDTGTQGVRIGVCDESGHIKCSGEKKWTTDYPKVEWAEQVPEEWWSNIQDTMEICFSKLTADERKSIVACSVCATSSTAFAVKEDGTPMMKAMMWMDARSKKEMEEINNTHHPILQYCGDAVSFEWLIPKVLWIKRHEPEIYQSCYRIVEQLDWINYQLCGVWAGSMCNASCKWNYVKSEGGFIQEYFDAIDLPEYKEKILTDIRPIGVPVGTIRPQLAEKYGLNPKMQIVQGSIDAHMAMFGMNVIEKRKMGIIMGTSFVHLSVVDEKPNIKGVWGPYDSAVVDGKWLLEGGQISASGLVNWFRENFHIDGEDGNPYKKLMDAAAEIEPGAEGITVLDFFQGNRTPYKDANAKGVIYGLNIKHSWKHIYRGILEAVAFGTRNIVDNQTSQGFAVDTVTACGGVTKDHVWMQIIADVLGKRLIVNEVSQAGVLGCCVVAAAEGRCYKTLQEAADHMVREKMTYEPSASLHDLYQQPYETYLELYQQLQGMMGK